MNPSYLFEAENLGFRPVTEEDIEYLTMLDGDPEVRHFFPGGAQTREIEERIKQYITDYKKKGKVSKTSLRDKIKLHPPLCLRNQTAEHQ